MILHKTITLNKLERWACHICWGVQERAPDQYRKRRATESSCSRKDSCSQRVSDSRSKALMGPSDSPCSPLVCIHPTLAGSYHIDRSIATDLSAKIAITTTIIIIIAITPTFLLAILSYYNFIAVFVM